MARTSRVLPLLILFALSHATSTAQDRAQFDFSGMKTVERVIDRTFPTEDAPFLFVSNRFGKVSVTTWDNPLVHASVRITAGAPSADVAERAAQAIDTTFDQRDAALHFETLIPIEDDIAGAGYRIDYDVRVPSMSSVSIENLFGDVDVAGVGGGLTIDARFGNIALDDIGGPVRVRARGEFDLTATNLEDGGHFLLRGTRATLSDTSGELHVSNYLGSVELRRVRSGDATIVSESGPIHFYLNENIATDLSARSDFGRIHTESFATPTRWGETEFIETRADDALGRVSLHSTFADTHIISDQIQTRLAIEETEGHRIREESTEIHDLRSGQVLRIDAAIGNVSIVATSDDRVTVRAQRVARVQQMADARLAIEGLGLRVADEPDSLKLTTAILEDMDALGCDEYGVDLMVECPAGVAVIVSSERGDVHLEGIAGAVDAELGWGHLSAASLSGESTLTNHRGDVTVSELSGDVTISATTGVVRARECSGAVDIVYDEGRAIVDTPGDSVRVRGVAGDTRIIALEGIRGDIDVQLEDGSISLATPDYADATFWLNTADGEIRSAYAVTGSIERGVYRFQGRLNDGTHRVLFETQRGNIRVD